MRIVLLIILILVGLAFFVIFINKDSVFPSLNTLKPKSETPSKNITVIAEQLDTPWSIAFLPDNSMLITERNGTVALIRKKEKSEITKLGNVKEYGEGGLMGMALDPNFSSNNFIYFYYTYSGNGNNTLNRVVRLTYKNGSLSEEKIIVDEIPGGIYHNGGRIKFGPDGLLYITTGDATQSSLAQDRDSFAGKILRVERDGKVAIYSYGHRNPQGIAWDESGQLWETEHGPSGIWPNCCQDEINKIEEGKNYGWPESVGQSVRSGTVGPVLQSDRNVWAPAGLAYHNGSLYFGGLKGEAFYKYNISTQQLTEYFKNEYGRLRDVVLGPDNFLYITTSNLDGRGVSKSGDDKIIKINPDML
ncbi:MAG: hypothetical protein A2798_02635 [Candidatus Levybacteria bacterium RIFCSPHIGHO2_01_FULL_37_17]|nr:MAG: hypothetical protein A2798_02635 [Candidatus Levybacteria bacterium RIFCSPHIGHO2_01_FULL_37_17]OGH36759.1 MAG: hypothetical protein A2959_00625 [Candidatus Levybacteria bacterium RIFCSPLOWO2_01_FULL_38_23]